MRNLREQRRKSIETAKHNVDPISKQEYSILPEGFDEEKYSGQGCGHLVPVTEGEVFDLGGITLRVVELPGHTRGSIGLVCKEKGLLYAGDALNGSLWLFLPESMNLETYIKTIQKAQQIDFDKLVMAHEPQLADKSVLEDFLDCAENLDFGKGIPFETTLVRDDSARTCIRQGFSEADRGKPGFAAIVIGESHL